MPPAWISTNISPPMTRGTCETCAALDGKHFKLKDAQAGVNYPPMHPNDRCTTVEYDPDDALDWYNSGQPMPEKYDIRRLVQTASRRPRPRLC